ncbi:MAG: Uma2 family endonuclease [Anaerolineae bacterium]|nr:Uma2 family endonuclease [Anaerolineae bacterium]
MVTQEKLMTVEEFWAQYAGQPYELVEGEVVPMTLTGLTHGFITSRVAAHLRSFVDEHQLGEVVGAETGFRLSDVALQAVDAAFVSKEKLARITEPDKFAPFAPDLAVEVVSPNDSASGVRQKVRRYLRAGTALVWVIYPELREVEVHRQDGTVQTATHADTLDGGDVLPGLALPVASLFPPQ